MSETVLLKSDNGKSLTLPEFVFFRLAKLMLDKANGSFTIHLNNGVITETVKVEETARARDWNTC